jgi:hypothetical protein
MLDPKRHIVFLPQDREIMDITGMSEEEYRWFVKQAFLYSKLRPGEPVADFGVSIAIAVVGLALSAASSLLFRPRVPQQQAQQQQRQIGGQDFVNNQRFAPTSGFDSVQNVVELGSTIPLVYANRRQVGDKVYGGVRVNTNLLWSQLYSVSGGQLLRAIFLVGEGTIPEPDPEQFAIGNNLLNNFDLRTDITKNGVENQPNTTSRLSLYYVDGSQGDNRITSEDYIAGRVPSDDLGNAENSGEPGVDVFMAARGKSSNFAPDFVYVSSPSNQTSFGVGAIAGNNLPYRLNPDIKPARNPEALGVDTNRQATAEREKDDQAYHGRAGVRKVIRGEQEITPANGMAMYQESELTVGPNREQISDDGDIFFKDDTEEYPTGFFGDASNFFMIQNADGLTEDQLLLERGLVALRVGDIVEYVIYGTSDYLGVFSIGEGDDEVRDDTRDIAQAVAGRQNSFDDAIQVGERYIVGTARGVCVSRKGVVETGPEQPDSVTEVDPIFNSEINNLDGDNEPVTNKGVRIIVQFEVTEPGLINIWTENDLNPPLLDDGRPKPFNRIVTGSRTTHLMRVSDGFVATERKSRFLEIGLRSTINMNFSGVCAWRNIEYSYDTIDDKNGTDAIFYTNPTYTSPETRYSCFKVLYKRASEENYLTFPRFFAVRSQSSSPVYNYLRFEFPEEDFWEIKLMPVSSFEVREGALELNVLDTKVRDSVGSIDGAGFNDTGVEVRFAGVKNIDVTSNEGQKLLSVQILGSGNFAGDALNGFDDPIGEDKTNPDLRSFHVDRYARLAEAFVINEITNSAGNPEHEIVYLNTQTSNDVAPDYANLAMVGLNIRSSREVNQLQQFSVYCEQGIGSTNRFPDVLKDLLTNKRYGTGTILNPEQIDFQSFEDAADFCESRRYFFDGVIDEKLNIRSWAAQTAQAFLLDFVIRNGKFALQPAVKLDGSVEEITGLYTAGNIIEDSFELSFVDEQERIPPRVQVRWRDEKSDQEKGNFPIIRQVTVRENTTPEDAPLEQIDATAFATSQEHAIDVGKFICRSKRLVTHSVSFSTTPPESSLDIGSVFKLGLETVNYDQPQNGAITSTGEVTAWPPLIDGSYPVLLWDGTDLQETTITVSNGKSSPAGSVFCLRNTTPRAGTYKTQSLSFNEEGNIQVEATFFPTNDQGISLIAEGFDDPDNWEIEGAI